MATLKHIASKNSDYSAAETYLVYQHDEFSGKKILDEQGRPKLRESYILDTLECGEASFATACLLANRKYDKDCWVFDSFQLLCKRSVLLVVSSVAAQLLIVCHAGFEVFHYGQRFMELGVKLCDSLVECVLIGQALFF